ncbi:type I polyketide synthase [Streptomyces sp. NPDC127068]|uniref:type I polyketide synthase n=1 Tax=Streptomyces sp. NPDC127068 TaxID=3347127 RepID=UPI00364DF959
MRKTSEGTADREPIAIIAMACRFPAGAVTPEKYWESLLSGVEAVGRVPADRWDGYTVGDRARERVLASTTPYGSFLDQDVYSFDPDFFGIAPREARLMDPQQRLALEVTWEALERAGVAPPDLEGSDTGVFMGVGSDDYGRPLLEDLAGIEPWSGIGASLCAVANRVSHSLDLRGPSVAVDTACSSSLVALHQACLSLRAGECGTALAGGVMLMTGPALTVVLDQAGALSADGRSKPFDAGADGYGRGEGCGVVVLRRLSDAAREGDPVLAVIRGCAVRQDGRTEGIMAPSQGAQEDLLRCAYQAAGVDPSTVDYVEAHGTGTRAGDPVEAGALAAVLGHGRPAGNPCLLGSVKGNIGHLEAAAGVAGLIKTVMVLQTGTVPATRSHSGPATTIDWKRSGLRLVVENASLDTPPDRPLRAAVASYGYGGTIAHAVLERWTPTGPTVRPTGTAPATLRVYPLSTGDVTALSLHARRLSDTIRDGLEDESFELRDVGHTLSAHRAHLGARAAVVAGDGHHLLAGLKTIAEERDGDPDVAVGRIGEDGDAPVWVFSGHGSQWEGMGRELLDREPAFAATIDRLAPWYAEEIGYTPRQALTAEPLGPVDRIQAALVAVHLGLADLWKHHGLRPGAVLGHSVGEIAAAATAGVLTQEEAARLACRRSRLLRGVEGEGAMAMVRLPFAEAQRTISADPDLVCAVASSSTSTVVSGTPGAVARWARRWEERGVPVKTVDSTVAFHSPQMSPLAERLARALDDLNPRPPRIPLYLTAVEDPRERVIQDGDYWARNLKEPVRFAEAVTAAVQDGHQTFVELSPHPVVAHSITEMGAERGVVAVPTLRRGPGEHRAFLRSLATLYTRGARPDWRRSHPAASLAPLPTMTWQRQHLRAEPSPRTGPGTGHTPESHTLVGDLTVSHDPAVHLWHTVLDRENRPYPRHHPVAGTEIVPAAVLLHTFAQAGRRIAGTAELPSLHNVDLRTPIALPRGDGARHVQLVGQGQRLTLSSRLGEEGREGDGESWQQHCSATFVPATPAVPVAPAAGATGTALPPEYVVERLNEVGVEDMGFPWETDVLHTAEGVLTVQVSCDPGHLIESPTWASALDAALSCAPLVIPGAPRLRMPAHLAGIQLTGPPPDRVTITVRLLPGRTDTVDIAVRGRGGQSFARITALRYTPLEDDERPVSTMSTADVGWRPLALPAERREEGGRVLLVGDRRLARALAPEFGRHGTSVQFQRTLKGEHLATADHVLLAYPRQSARQHAEAFVRDVRTLTRHHGDDDPTVWWVTRGVRESTDEAAVEQAPLWGMSRVFATENPLVHGGTVDLRAEQPGPHDAAALLQLLQERPDDDIVSIRDGTCWSRRLLPVALGEGNTTPLCRAEGTYLITGGLGALGLRVAAHLVRQGAHRLVLASRTGLPDRAHWDDPDLAEASQERVRAVRALESTGAVVMTPAVDVADPRALRRALDDTQLPPVAGVVHAAGTVENALLTEVDDAALRRVMRAKTHGALALHRMFPPGTVDFMLLFSSAGPLLGLPGQGAYAAANTYLDALARHRRAAGAQDTVSVAFTSWHRLGMAASADATDAELAVRGASDLSETQALRALTDVLNGRRTIGASIAVLSLLHDSEHLRPPLMSTLPALRPQDDTPDAAPWADLTGDALHEAVTDQVRRAAARVLGATTAHLSAERPLSQQGMDSLLTVRFRVELNRCFGLATPPALLWENPTLTALTAYLSTRLTDPTDEASPADR